MPITDPNKIQQEQLEQINGPTKTTRANNVLKQAQEKIEDPNDISAKLMAAGDNMIQQSFSEEAKPDIVDWGAENLPKIPGMVKNAATNFWGNLKRLRKEPEPSPQQPAPAQTLGDVGRVKLRALPENVKNERDERIEGTNRALRNQGTDPEDLFEENDPQRHRQDVYDAIYNANNENYYEGREYGLTPGQVNDVRAAAGRLSPNVMPNRALREAQRLQEQRREGERRAREEAERREREEGEQEEEPTFGQRFHNYWGTIPNPLTAMRGAIARRRANARQTEEGEELEDIEDINPDDEEIRRNMAGLEQEAEGIPGEEGELEDIEGEAEPAAEPAAAAAPAEPAGMPVRRGAAGRRRPRGAAEAVADAAGEQLPFDFARATPQEYKERYDELEGKRNRGEGLTEPEASELETIRNAAQRRGIDLEQGRREGELPRFSETAQRYFDLTPAELLAREGEEVRGMGSDEIAALAHGHYMQSTRGGRSISEEQGRRHGDELGRLEDELVRRGQGHRLHEAHYHSLNQRHEEANRRMEAEGYSERLPVGQELYRAAMEGRGRRFADLGDVMRNENPQEAGEERRRREEAVGAARRQAEEERRREAAAPPPPRLPAPDAYGGDNGWDAYPDRTVLMMSGRGNIDRLDPRDIAALYNRNMGMLSSGTMDGRPLTDEQRERLRANNRYMMQAYQMRMAERENAGRAEGRRAAATAGREQGREDREELIRRRTEEREDLIRRSGLFEESPERAPLDRFYELLRGHNGDLFEEPKKTEEPEEAAELEAERGGSVGPLAIALPVLMGATAGMMALPDGRRHRPSRTITAERREASRVRRGQQEAVRDRVRREREAFRADDRGTVRIDLRRIEREMREVERRRRAEDHAARQRAEHEAAVARNDERIRARRELNVRRRTEQGEAGDRVRRERAAFRADDRGTMRIRQGRQEGEPARATAGDRGLMGHLRVERGREAQAERDAADAGLRRAIAAAPVSPEEAREAARGYPIPQRVSRTADVTFRRPRTDYSREQLRLLRDAAFNERLVRSGLARGSRNLEFEHLSDQDLMNIGLGLE